MSTEEKKLERAQVKVGANSLHYRMYLYTQRHSRGKPPYYRENLCHYMRAVLIWAPLLWFFRVPFKSRSKYFGWVRPWMVVLLAFLTGFLVYALERWSTTTKLVLLIAVLGIVAVAVVVGAIVGGVYVWTRNSKLSEKVFYIITAPAWIPVAVVAVAIVLVVEKVLEPCVPPFLRWFFTRRYLKVIYPCWVGALIATGVSYVLFGFHYTWIALAIIGGIAIGLALILGLILGAYWLLSSDEFDAPGRISEWHDSRRPVSTTYVANGKTAPVKGTSVFRIIWQFILTQKWKICPFIILPGTEDQNSRRYI